MTKADKEALKAIKAYCEKQCRERDGKPIKDCQTKACPIWPWRMGRTKPQTP